MGTLAIAITALAATASAQTPAGEQVFRDRCASCHNGQPDSRAPAADALKPRTPQAILEALVNGPMRVQGSKMSGAERRAVAEYITEKRVEDDVVGAATGRCTKTAALGPMENISRGPRWSGWSPAPANTRFQPADQAGLAAADLSRLTLKWAFGFPDAASAWAQPTVAAGRVFVGSQNGTVYSLDAATGCIHWTFSAGGGVRTAITLGPLGSRTAAYFGDTAANAYAVDADTGAKIWMRKVDEHPLARITGSPALFEGRLYVPVSSYEESQGADPQYGCCSFRGNVVALDAATGSMKWKTYMVADAATPRGKSSAAVQLWGPSGSSIWSAPTIDVRRRALYVATGNTYSGPPQPSSDAVVALDLATGAIKWMRQATPGDIYVSGCRAGNPNCPETNGPDLDFGSPPMLATVVDSAQTSGRDLIVIGQKSGVGFALDPDKNGEIVWQYRAGEGGVLGGIEWGSAVDGTHAYFAVSDITRPRPGGLHAVALATGERVWMAAPAAAKCGTGRGCNTAQSAALTAIPGAIFSGSNDGALRAFSTKDGAVIWEFDSNRDFVTVNGVRARGASMIGPGPAIAGGMIFVNSGYGAFGGGVLVTFSWPSGFSSGGIAMKFVSLVSAIAVAAVLTVSAQDTRVPPNQNAPTFSKDVAPILYSKCVTCHRPGEVAPMSLITFKDARPWARAIRDKVVSREMPPWFADPAHGAFRNDRSLTQAQIDTIVKWVDGGARQGDEKLMPAVPALAAGWQIGKPDLVFEMPTEFKIPADGTVEYQYFEVATNFKEDRWVSAGEVRAGNPEHVHHIIVSVIEPAGSSSRPNVMSVRAIADGSNAGPRPARQVTDAQRAQLATAARRGNAVSLVNWAVGEDPPSYPAGMAKRIPAGSTLQFQVHYTTNGAPATDRSRIGLIFTKEPPKNEMRTALITNTQFAIPAGAANHQIEAEATFNENVKVWYMHPHMHMRGKDMTYTAIYPDGRQEIVLRVPKYDFGWQTDYALLQPLSLPKGSKLHVTAHFDNSTANRANPDPTSVVRWGDQTWEEMMIGYITYTVDSAAIATVAQR